MPAYRGQHARGFGKIAVLGELRAFKALWDDESIWEVAILWG